MLNAKSEQGAATLVAVNEGRIKLSLPDKEFRKTAPKRPIDSEE